MKLIGMPSPGTVNLRKGSLTALLDIVYISSDDIWEHFAAVLLSTQN